MGKRRELLLIGAAAVGFLLAFLPRVIRKGLGVTTVIGGLLALVAVVVVMVVLLRQPAGPAEKSPDLFWKAFPQWGWWALGLAIILRAVAYFLGR